MEQVSSSRSFGGEQRVYSHRSAETGTDMRFGIYLPPQAASGPRPVLYWLSGLTCTEENFITKAGAQRVAAELGLVIVAPDTSPRGLGHPGEDDSYDFGTGAGFYVDATAEPWRNGYRMHTYVVEELPTLVSANFPVDVASAGIFGHSMGGLIGLYYVKKLGGAKRVRRLIMMGSPAHGTWAALAGVVTIGLISSASWQLLPRSRFLDELNQGPLPPEVDVITLAAARDWFCPVASTKVRGATNITLPMGHSSLVVSGEVYKRLVSVLRADRDRLRSRYSCDRDGHFFTPHLKTGRAGFCHLAGVSIMAA